MRGTHLWLAALSLSGCAHRTGAEPVPESQAQALSRAAHPAYDVGEIDQPSARAAATPTADESSAARIESAAPPTHPTVAGEAKLETTASRPDAPVAPPEPATAEVIGASRPSDVPQTPAAHPGAETVRADAKLRERVQRALLNARSLSYTAKHVQVDVAQRAVTLRGEVRTAHERSELDKLVGSLPGVEQLNNQVALIDLAVPYPPQR